MPSRRDEVGASRSGRYCFSEDRRGLRCWSEEGEDKGTAGDWFGGGVGRRESLHACPVPPRPAPRRNASAYSQGEPYLLCCFQNLLLHKNHKYHYSEKPSAPLLQIFKFCPVKFLGYALFCANAAGGSVPEKQCVHWL